MYNGYNQQNHHHNDEQLLEDLPGDENMQRLFWIKKIKYNDIHFNINVNKIGNLFINLK